jgi:hypothetical protein
LVDRAQLGRWSLGGAWRTLDRRRLFAQISPQGRGSGWAGAGAQTLGFAWRKAPRPLRCSVDRPAAKLASLTAFVPLKQSPRVSGRSATASRGRSPCASQEPRHSPQPLPSPPLGLVRLTAACRHRAPPPALQGCGRALAAVSIETPEKHRACGRARSAPRELTHRECLSAANAVSGASFAVGRWREHRRGRAAQQRATARFRTAARARPQPCRFGHRMRPSMSAMRRPRPLSRCLATP